MICPKCGFDQPESAECARCGIIVSRYKGPVLGVMPPPPLPVAVPLPLTSTAPPPPPQTGSTLYGGPAAALAGADGGTIYQGPMPPPLPPTVGTAPRPAVRADFNSGKILGETFSIYFANFLPFVLLTAFAMSPVYVLQANIAMQQGSTPESPTIAISGLLLAFALLVSPYVATAAITYGVFQTLRGADTSVGDCLGKGFSALFPVLGLAFIQGLRVLIGLMLCFIPGILWALKWSVSVPAAVEEKPGVMGAMDRSALLTEGYRGDVFGVLFVLSMLNIGLTLVITMAVRDPGLRLLIMGLKDLPAVGLSATAPAVMYYRLRSIKESIDVDQIASVFA